MAERTTPEPRRPAAALVSVLVVLLAGVAGIGLVSRDTLAPPPALPVPIDTEPEGGWSAFPGPTYRLGPGVGIEAREAPAFSLAGNLDRKQVDALKSAVGMRGEFVRRGDWWQLEDGKRVLRIEEGPTRPWFFFTPPGAAPPPRGAVPSPADAERIGRDLLSAAGFELGSRTEVNSGGDHWNVNVGLGLSGVPVIGMPMSVVVGRGGAIVSAMGHLAVGENLGWYGLTPLDRSVDSMNGGEAAPKAAPPRLVKSARLVLSRMYQLDMYARAVVLAPHYELTLDDDSTVSHLAVAEEHLDPRRLPDPYDEQPIPEPEPYPAP